MMKLPPIRLTAEKSSWLFHQPPSNRTNAVPPLPLLVALTICSMPLAAEKSAKPMSTAPSPRATIWSLPLLPLSA